LKLSDGSYLVNESELTSFTNSEEDAAGLSSVMPFMLETQLQEHDGKFKTADNWAPKVVVGKEGKLITGQNPASATPIGKAILERISARVAPVV
jgi:putative intracellular protease/amidase